MVYAGILFQDDFETGQTVVFEDVKPNSHSIRLAPGDAVSQWPENGGIGLIEGNLPGRGEEFCYARRHGDLLTGVESIDRLHPRFCPIQTSTLEKWGTVGYPEEVRDLISHRHTASQSGGYSACISMASPRRIYLQRYSEAADTRLIRFSFICSRELLNTDSLGYLRLFELFHDYYDLPCLAITKNRGDQSPRICVMSARTRRLGISGRSFKQSSLTVEPDSLYTVNYRYWIVSGDTVSMSVRVNETLLDSTRIRCIPSQKTPRYQFRIGKLLNAPLPGELFLDNITETTLPWSLPPQQPLLLHSDGRFYIRNAPDGRFDA
jgi:hypothetical protein